ncbi:MAG: hypothetical protein N3I35_07900 [Clostridia bacterium]|nr:hypothetical protein [Clostridia bacterium]
MTALYRKLIVFICIVLLGTNTACTMPFSSAGKAVSADKIKSGKKEISAVSKLDTEMIEKVISDYVLKLYSLPIETSTQCSVNGNIPYELRNFMSLHTLKLADSNPEIGIHMPRYVSLNGVTAIGYEILANEGKKGSPEVFVLCTGKKGDIVSCYVKVGLRAKCIPDDFFDKVFKRNPQSYVYEKMGSVDESKVDYIKVQARYNVEVIKEDKEYKISKMTEADLKPGIKNRISRHNNEFIIRLPYLSISALPMGNVSINRDDEKVFNEEKTVIQSFFEGIARSVDNEKSNLLYLSWTSNDYAKLLDCIKKIEALNGEKGRKISDLMDINSEYMSKFEFEAFPLRSNMSSIKSLKNFRIMPHPGYSEKNKKYIVNFEASVEKTNGISGEEQLYRYDYFVTVNRMGDSVKVIELRLNECFCISSS